MTRTPEEVIGIIKPTKKIIRTISRVHSKRPLLYNHDRSETEETNTDSSSSSSDLYRDNDDAPPLLSILHVGGRYMTRCEALKARDGRCTLNGRVMVSIYDPSMDIKNGLLETRAIELRTEEHNHGRRLRRIHRISSPKKSGGSSSGR